MLRRTPFKSKLPPPRPVRQYTGSNPSAPRVPGPTVVLIHTPVLAMPKEDIVRSRSYLRFVASHACFDCGVGGFSQAAHENYGKGLSLKVSDLRTFPLCAPRFGLLGCHQEFDLGLGLTRDERRVQGQRWVERMLALARAAGRKELP